jgi:hypothetical protein
MRARGREEIKHAEGKDATVYVKSSGSGGNNDKWRLLLGKG